MNIVGYTDGSCKKNPGIGGWGCLIIIHKDEWKLNLRYNLYGGTDQTTNQRMELKAMLKFLGFCLNSKSSNIIVYTDSEYVIKGIVGEIKRVDNFNSELKKVTFPLQGWLGKKLFNTNLHISYNYSPQEYWSSVPKNDKLWYKVYQLLLWNNYNNNKIEIGWVRGHSKNKGNEKADELANKYYLEKTKV